MFAGLDSDGSGAVGWDEFSECIAGFIMQLEAEAEAEAGLEGGGIDGLPYWKTLSGLSLDDLTDSERRREEAALVRALTVGSGVADPLHLLPQAVGTMAAMQGGYRILQAIRDKNISLSGAQQRIVARLMGQWGYSRRKTAQTMPFRARQLEALLAAHTPLAQWRESLQTQQTSLAVTASSHSGGGGARGSTAGLDASGRGPGSRQTDSEAWPGSARGAAESADEWEAWELDGMVSKVDVPDEDISRLDQAVLWIWRSFDRRAGAGS